MKYDYTENNLKKIYSSFNLKKKDVIYITGNLVSLGKFEGRNILESHYKAVSKAIGGLQGTIVVPTHSFNLVRSNKPFFPTKTVSETGALTEYIRKKKGSVRQLHPYSSHTAIGKHAKYICTNNGPNVFGPDSPFDRLIKLNAKFIGFGIQPGITASQVHHAEFMMNVPYRYSKEFTHKIKTKTGFKKKNFYLHVIYKNLIHWKRDRNKVFFKEFLKKNRIVYKKIGKSYMYMYSLKKFYETSIECLKKDIYCWLPRKPKISERTWIK